mgnify:CR=1 FL=1
MGIFVNSDNSAFQVALNSEIYIDKTGLLTYTNKVMNTLQGYICNRIIKRHFFISLLGLVSKRFPTATARNF